MPEREQHTYDAHRVGAILVFQRIAVMERALIRKNVKKQFDEMCSYSKDAK